MMLGLTFNDIGTRENSLEIYETNNLFNEQRYVHAYSTTQPATMLTND